LQPPTELEDKGKAATPRRRTSVQTLTRTALIAGLLAAGTAAVAYESRSGGALEEAGIGSAVVFAGSVAIFALVALFAYERKQLLERSVGGHNAPEVAGRPAARTPGSGRALWGVGQCVASGPGPVADRRPIEALLKKKKDGIPPSVARPAAHAVRDAEPTIERKAPLSPPNERGVRESGEERFSVVSGGALEPFRADSNAPASSTKIPRPEEARAAEKVGPRSRAERCEALRTEGRLEEAARIARQGLADEEEPGPLLLELSRAYAAMGRTGEAVDTARDALFVWRSRETVEHLMRILTDLRRFASEDGAMLRRAASRHPNRALLRHAAGVFESLHGSPQAAGTHLRAALGLETDPTRCAAIKLALARLTQADPVGPGIDAGGVRKDELTSAAQRS
jgi:hypothetical protein